MKWEYDYAIASSLLDVLNISNDLGKEGWEVITTMNDKNENIVLFLKRPLVD